MTARGRMLLETTAARDKAEALLRGLLDARSRTERRTHMPVSAGASIDDAIASTQQMIEALNRTICGITRDLGDDGVLDEAVDAGR